MKILIRWDGGRGWCYTCPEDCFFYNRCLICGLNKPIQKEVETQTVPFSIHAHNTFRSFWEGGGVIKKYYFYLLLKETYSALVNIRNYTCTRLYIFIIIDFYGQSYDNTHVIAKKSDHAALIRKNTWQSFNALLHSIQTSLKYYRSVNSRIHTFQ